MAVITESSVFLLLLHPLFFFLFSSFVLLSSVDSVAGFFAELSFSSPYSRRLAVYFWLSFIWRLVEEGGVLRMCVAGVCSGVVVELLSAIHPSDLLRVPKGPSPSTTLFCLLICIKHTSVHPAISLFRRSLTWKSSRAEFSRCVGCFFSTYFSLVVE